MKSNIKTLSHISVHGCKHNAYISVCHTTMRLHVYKYDQTDIEWDTFTSVREFKEWVLLPLKRAPIELL